MFLCIFSFSFFYTSTGTELVCAFYACLLIGAIPVPVRPPRIDSSAPGGGSSVSATISSGPIGLLSGPPGSGSSSGISLLGLGGGGGHNGNSPVSGSAGQLSSGTGSFPNVYFRPNTPSLDASLDLIWNVVKHSGATVIFTQNNLIKLLKSKVSAYSIV